MKPCTLSDYEQAYKDRHLLHGVLARWAEVKPEAAALVNHNRTRTLKWAELESLTTAVAAGLLRLGFRRGDYLAASLPFLTEHVLLEYACFKIGVIHAPLDLRLSPAEVLRCLAQINPRGFAFLGKTPAADFRELGLAVRRGCASVEHLIQFSPAAETVEGAIPFERLAGGTRCEQPADAVHEDDPAQVIFTTGSTGSPKPALLSHRNITCQNLCLGTAFGFGESTRLLVNLPPSHVGGQAEALMTTFFWGGTVILLEVFDATRSLEVVERHRVNILGQIPAMYNYEWRLADFDRFDLSSLEIAIYGGQQVSRPFLERLSRMAPRIATGLGLTEAAGFCTYTPAGGVDEVLAGIGRDMPLYRMSIRAPMRSGGLAGEELPAGEVGEICFTGPQTFLGYVNDPESTARTISRDGFLYTGDMGSVDGAGLRFSGRSKWIIKPGGHQVFPGDVESHIAALDEKVSTCAAVGVAHQLLSEAIVAFVEKKPGVELTVAELRRHARSLTSYMRPLHYVILEPGSMPLNRAAKSDYLRLRETAELEAKKLGWSAAS
ncbi:MAG: class I adenylate-forming enzyme family protein [Bryobacteraceae bacterium]